MATVRGRPERAVGPRPGGLGTARASGALRHGHRARDDAVARSPAARWQGLGLEHHDYAADASGKESGGGAH
jgi:hypothetical protein